MRKARISCLILFLSVSITRWTAAAPITDALPPISAYSVGTASSGVALCNDPSVVYWNPGSIGLIEKLAVDFTVAAPNFESPGSWSFIMTNGSDNEGSQFGFGMLRRHFVRDAATIKTFTLFLPLSYPIIQGSLPVGVNVKFITESIDDSPWHYGMNFDFGSIWRTDSGIQVGLSRLNSAGSNLSSYEGESWFGLAWEGEELPLTVMAQTRFNKPFDSERLAEYLSGGLDFRIPTLTGVADKNSYCWSVRTGFKRELDNRWWTGGFEVRKGGDDIHIAYSMAVNTRGWKDRIHLLTYGYRINEKSIPRGGFVVTPR